MWAYCFTDFRILGLQAASPVSPVPRDVYHCGGDYSGSYDAAVETTATLLVAAVAASAAAAAAITTVLLLFA